MYNPYIETSKSANRRKKGLAIVGVALSAALAVGGITAYLTDWDDIKSNFTMGVVDIEMTPLTDSNNDGEADVFVNIQPTQTITVDTTITNKSTVESFLAVTVKTPVYNTGTADTPVYTDLYTPVYKTGVTFDSATNESTEWEKKVVTDNSDIDTTNMVRTTTYYYKNKLAAKDTKANVDLISGFKTADYNRIPDIKTKAIEVKAIAMQATELNKDGVTYTNAKDAFAKFDSENGNTAKYVVASIS